MAVSGDNRFLPKLLTFSRRLIFVSISVILGAVIFMSIENTGIEPEVKEQPRSCPVESLKARICRQLNITMSEAEYVSLIDSIGFHVSRRLNVTVNKTAFRTALQGSQESVQPPIIQRAEKWSFTSGIHFAWTVITTIGYGTKTPKTIAGKIVTILYAILGIPICLMAVAAAGDLIKHIIEKLLVFIELKCLKRDHVEKIHRKVLFAEIFSFVVELLLRAEVTHKLYGWTYMDAVYSWFITFSTIGFGDLVPHLTQDKGFSTSNVIGSMFFELFALGTLASITKTTVEMLEKRAKKKSKVYCNEIPSCCGKKGVRTEDIQLGEVSHGDEKIENSNDQNLEEKAVGT